jgi:aquaporin Z
MTLTGRSMRKYWAEMTGTFVLVFVGVGTALAVGGQQPVGNLGIGLAFGLAVLAASYAYARNSGGHFNPAVTIGAAVAGRIAPAEIVRYIVAQLVGGIIAALLLYVIATGRAGFNLGAGFASNGYATHSPGGYSLIACLIAELVLTGLFVCVYLGSTGKRAAAGFSPIAIGLALAAIHFASLPITSTSVNPARSTATALIPAIFGTTTWPITELWLFWLAPILGAAIAGWAHRELFGDE